MIAGSAGSLLSLFVLVCGSALLTLLTTLSMSAVVSNERGRVARGGAYRLISSALGIELGAAVGLMYYLGLVFLCTLEILGLVELFIFYFSDELHFPASKQLFAAIMLVLLTLLVRFALPLVSKLSKVFVSIVLLTMIFLMVGLTTDRGSHRTGPSARTFRANLAPHFTKSGFAGFSEVLALFFPAMTDILSGVNRAEHLSNAQRQVPLGTIGSILFSCLIYAIMLLMWTATIDHGILSVSHHLLFDLFWPASWLALPLVFISSLSQSLQIVIIAPRVLQAIAAHKAIGFLAPFAVLTGGVKRPISTGQYAGRTSTAGGRSVQAMLNAATGGVDSASGAGFEVVGGQPHRALYLTGGIAVAVAMIGSLEVVAPMLAQLFLLCYLALNLSCVVFEVLHSPSWRPSFRFFSKWSALLGAIMCILWMFFISWYFAIAVFVICAALYAYIDWRGVETKWGDGLSGLRYQLALNSLLSTELGSIYSRNWRPQLLVLIELPDEVRDDYGRTLTVTALPEDSGDEAIDREARAMLALASHLRKGNGLCIVGGMLVGTFIERAREAALLKELLWIQMDKHELRGFPEVLVGSSKPELRDLLVQSAGLGGLSPNTVMVRYPCGLAAATDRVDSFRRALHFVDSISTCTCAEKALLSLRLDDGDGSSVASGFPVDGNEAPLTGSIDVWWILHDGALLLLLAYLMQRHAAWRASPMRVFTVIEAEDNAPELRAELAERIAEMQIEASVEVVVVPAKAIAFYASDSAYRNLIQDEVLAQLATRSVPPSPGLGGSSTSHAMGAAVGGLAWDGDGSMSGDATATVATAEHGPRMRRQQSAQLHKQLGSTFASRTAVAGTPRPDTTTLTAVMAASDTGAGTGAGLPSTGQVVMRVPGLARNHTSDQLALLKSLQDVKKLARSENTPAVMDGALFGSSLNSSGLDRVLPVVAPAPAPAHADAHADAHARAHAHAPPPVAAAAPAPRPIGHVTSPFAATEAYNHSHAHGHVRHGHSPLGIGVPHPHETVLAAFGARNPPRPQMVRVASDLRVSVPASDESACSEQGETELGRGGPRGTGGRRNRGSSSFLSYSISEDERASEGSGAGCEFAGEGESGYGSEYSSEDNPMDTYLAQLRSIKQKAIERRNSSTFRAAVEGTASGGSSVADRDSPGALLDDESSTSEGPLETPRSIEERRRRIAGERAWRQEVRNEDSIPSLASPSASASTSAVAAVPLSNGLKAPSVSNALPAGKAAHAGKAVPASRLVGKQLPLMARLAALSDSAAAELMDTPHDDVGAWRVLNSEIRRRSAAAAVVLINIPDVFLDPTMPEVAARQSAVYSLYVETVLRLLPRTILVHGTGKEFVSSV